MFIASHRPWLWSCALGAWLAALPVGAAEPPPPGLNWVRLPGAQECISAAALAERVEARVGRVLFAPATEAGVFVDGHVAPAAEGGFQVVLELSAPGGEVLGRREMHFDGADCSVIDDAVALVIAVTLYPNTSLLDAGIPLDPSTAASLQALFGQEPTDPDPESLPSAPDVSVAREAEQPARSERSADAAPAPEPPPAPTWGYGVAVAAAGAEGHLPGLRPGVAVHAAATPPSAWPIEAGVLLLPQTTEQRSGVSGRARFDLLLATLSLCPWQPTWLRALWLCAGGELGRLHVESEGFAAGSVSANDVVASVTGTARLRVPLGGALELGGAVVLALPLDQRRYTVQRGDGSTETLFRIPQLAARAELGLALSL